MPNDNALPAAKAARRGATSRPRDAATLPVTRATFDEVMVPCYAPAQFIPVRGEGSRVWDQQGRMYIDFASGVAVTSLGHCHPAMVKALERAGAARSGTCRTGSPTSPRCGSRSASSTRRSPSARSSATPAPRRTRRRSSSRAATRTTATARTRRASITAVNAFHGRTLFTVTAGGQPKYSAGFGPNPAGFTHVPYNDVAALEAEFAEHGTEICAVMLEPMQGEGGMTPGTPEFLQAARRLCTAHDALLILDEIQSGMGRTGALFSYMQKGIVPDILTSAKGLGGGFPIGAMLTTTDDRAARSARACTARPTAATRSPARSPARCSTSSTPPRCSTASRRGTRCSWKGLRAINARRNVFADMRGEGVWIGCELDDAWRGKAAASCRRPATPACWC